MKLLLDTHALLWFLMGDARFSPLALAALNDPANQRWLSPISLLEIAVKLSIGKLSLTVPFGAMFPAQLHSNRIQLLPIEAQHAAAVAVMPLHHRDPFDRLLVAQALTEGMDLLSADAAFDAYGVRRIW
jgi:PIN domain nuclease of toxin-antitoxin system